MKRGTRFMTDSYVKVDGLNELLADLEKVEDPKRQASVMKRSLNAGLRVVRDAMRASAPRGRTGLLAKDVRTKITARRGVVSGRVGVFNKASKSRPKRGRSGNTKAPPNTVIAAWLEYGVAAHRIPGLLTGRGRNKRLNLAKAVINGNVLDHVEHPGIRPKPWLRPALDANEARALEVAAEAFYANLLKELE